MSFNVNVGRFMLPASTPARGSRACCVVFNRAVDDLSCNFNQPCFYTIAQSEKEARDDQGGGGKECVISR